MRRIASLLALLALALVASASQQSWAHQAKDEALPNPPVTLQIIAPSARGPWLLRIDNTGDSPVRIAADARLLRLAIAPPAKKDRRGRLRKQRKVVCSGPAAFGVKDFPPDRELILAPGRSFVQQFDPRALCFGKKAKALIPDAAVQASYGWARRRGRRMQVAPFVADTAKRRRKFRPLKHLNAPAFLLSDAPPVVFGLESAAVHTLDERVLRGNRPRKRGKRGGRRYASKKDVVTEPQPAETADEASRYRPVHLKSMTMHPKDELGARLSLTASRYVDARRPSDLVLSVQVHNTGDRPVYAALRSRQLSFDIYGPNGRVRCSRLTSGHHVPKQLFRTLYHGKHKHMYVRLVEHCPNATFDRPGLYFAVPTLHADADGREYGFQAATGVVTVRHPGRVGGTHVEGDDMTMLRVRRGTEPYYRGRPISLPTHSAPTAKQRRPSTTEQSAF